MIFFSEFCIFVVSIFQRLELDCLVCPRTKSWFWTGQRSKCFSSWWFEVEFQGLAFSLFRMGVVGYSLYSRVWNYPILFVLVGIRVMSLLIEIVKNTFIPMHYFFFTLELSVDATLYHITYMSRFTNLLLVNRTVIGHDASNRIWNWNKKYTSHP